VTFLLKEILGQPGCSVKGKRFHKKASAVALRSRDHFLHPIAQVAPVWLEQEPAFGRQRCVSGARSDNHPEPVPFLARARDATSRPFRLGIQPCAEGCSVSSDLNLGVMW
jgi:hypothetical protein